MITVRFDSNVDILEKDIKELGIRNFDYKDTIFDMLEDYEYDFESGQKFSILYGNSSDKKYNWMFTFFWIEDEDNSNKQIVYVIYDGVTV